MDEHSEISAAICTAKYMMRLSPLIRRADVVQFDDGDVENIITVELNREVSK